MTNIDERKLAALAKKNAAKAANPKTDTKANRRRKYDPTLQPEAEEDGDLRAFFSEMKKRDF